MKIWEKKRVGTVIRIIWGLFNPRLPSPDGKHRFNRTKVPAKEALALVPGSKMTIIKARKFLGVQASIVAGKHTWLKPIRSLEEALAEAGKGSNASIYRVRKENRDRNIAKASEIQFTAQKLFAMSKYCLSASQVKKALCRSSGAEYEAGTYAELKRRLGIIVTNYHEEWLWLMPNEEIEQWLRVQMRKGPVAETELLARMAKKYNQAFLFKVYMKGHGFIRTMMREEWHWYDINSWSPDLGTIGRKHGTR